MLKGKTQSGFAYSIDERILSDIKTLRAIRAMSNAQNDIGAIDSAFDFFEIVLGTDQLEALDKHLRKKNDGFATLEMLQAEVTEIFNSHKESKNS